MIEWLLVVLVFSMGFAIGNITSSYKKETSPKHKTYREGYQEKLFDVSKSLCDTCQNAMKLKQRYKTTDDNVNFCKVPLQGVTQSLVPTKVMECSEYIECRHYRQE